MEGYVNGRKFDARRRAVIRGTGSAVPAKILDNAALEKLVETSDEWITTRTGIKERRIISEGETTASLALEAGKRALDRAGMLPSDLDMIICATITPEMVFPATACFVQDGLGNRSCSAFDLTAACSGFTYAMATAGSFISSGQIDTAMVIGAETLSTITNYADRTSCILFGDGAGAAILKAEENTDRGLIYSSLHADGSGWQTLCCKAYGSRYPAGKPLPEGIGYYMDIRGRETYQLAVRRIVELIEESYRVCGICSDDIKMLIPHQMKARIIESVGKRLDLPPEKIFVNIDRYGNTSAASIAIAMDEAIRQKHLKEGDLIVLVAFGAGITWAVNLIRL